MILLIIRKIIIMVNTDAHGYAENGKVIELQREIRRDRNVVHEKNDVRVY